ncbi:UNVERIFIED_CONTAM: Methylesterase 10 [Sesamum radiatum]|uniref:Methylesterase 10 n=1 Tax=Sesamum radiatum TaxID=300843 RepID=A0AAW2P3T2_SESRA
MEPGAGTNLCPCSSYRVTRSLPWTWGAAGSTPSSSTRFPPSPTTSSRCWISWLLFLITVIFGHSYGGIPISLAMENFPGKISVAVFVSAYMPNCSDPPATLIQEFLKRSSTNSLMDCEITFDHQTSQKLPISAAFGPEYMAKMYANCPSEDLELAKTMVRPSLIFLEELSKTCLLSEERYGAVKRCYVICEEDEVMEEEFQRYIIEKSPPEDVVSIAGAGHMIMLAKPQELCSCLTELIS